MRKVHDILTQLQTRLSLRIAFGALAVIACLSTAGCVSTNEVAGVDNVWRDQSVAFTNGISTTDDVLKMLGPPSQVISLGEQTVFYYVREKVRERAYITFVYNVDNTEITYDRAAFFFNSKGVLVTHSYSKEAIERKVQ
jgi:outer membrane protein assembly factor BamE (lipoprotein component of BamABCDE complex)